MSCFFIGIAHIGCFSSLLGQAFPALPSSHISNFLWRKSYPPYNHSEDLICRQGKYSEHQMAHHLGGSAYANVPAAELILEPRVDPFTHGALFVAVFLCRTQLRRSRRREGLRLSPAGGRIDDPHVPQAAALLLNVCRVVSRVHQLFLISDRL